MKRLHGATVELNKAIFKQAVRYQAMQIALVTDDSPSEDWVEFNHLAQITHKGETALTVSPLL